MTSWLNFIDLENLASPLFDMGLLIDSFERRFVLLDRRSRSLMKMTPEDRLFWRPRDPGQSMTPFSCGEYILRSAAMVERSLGGIMTRLWDDPFEWTLPEAISNTAKVLAYLLEVEKTRSAGFAFLRSDEDLSKEIPAPERLRPIADILVEAIAQAEHYQGRAFSVFQMFSDEKLPRL